MPAIHLIIKGKVQGVFYRVSSKKKAEALGVTGWVKNTKEGHVEITAEGPDEQLKQFVDWCRQGPPRSRVENVSQNEVEEKEPTEFKILHN